MNYNDPSNFHKIYKEISDSIGVEAAYKIYQMFRGTQVSFPIRLLDTQCAKKLIQEEYNGKNIRELAKKYEYSEKSIRRILKEGADKGNN